MTRLVYDVCIIVIEYRAAYRFDLFYTPAAIIPLLTAGIAVNVTTRASPL